MKWLAVVVLFLLTSCGVSEGTVYDKRFEAAHNEERERSVYATHCGYSYGLNSDGSYGYGYRCKYEFDHTEHYQVWIKDCYRLLFKNEKGHKGNACVPEWEYNEKQIGSYYKEDS